MRMWFFFIVTLIMLYGNNKQYKKAVDFLVFF